MVHIGLNWFEEQRTNLYEKTKIQDKIQPEIRKLCGNAKEFEIEQI